MPPAVVALDDRILDGPLRDIAGEHDIEAPRAELGRMRGVGHLDPPVLGAGRGAAQVQPPPAVGQAHELRALQRFGVQLFLGYQRQRLEVHPVAREGEGHGVTPAAAYRPAQPAGEIDALLGQDRRGGADPVSGTRPRRGDGYDRVARAREEHGPVRITTNHIGIIENSAALYSRTRRPVDGGDSY